MFCNECKSFLLPSSQIEGAGYGANERKGRNTMDDLRAHKLKKYEQAIQEWLDFVNERGMSEDEIDAEFERMFENGRTEKLRG